MKPSIATMRENLRGLEISSSLTFLNHVLAVARGERRDRNLEQAFAQPVPEFLCHFLAKEVVLHGSLLAPHRLGGWQLHKFFDQFLALEDPILSDPAWKNLDPTGWFERTFSQQLAPQNLVSHRAFGLALALFGDAAPEFDLRAACEHELGMPLEAWMQCGFLCSAAAGALSNRGSVTLGYLRKARVLGFRVAHPEIWEPFLHRIACTPERFREIHAETHDLDERFAPTEYNPLVDFPIIDVGKGRYVVPDPKLLIGRTTWGLFNDLNRRLGVPFRNQFGPLHSRLVGRLLESVLPAQRLWSDDPRKYAALGKRADWAYVCSARKVLIECKSTRPTPELFRKGSEIGVAYAAKRVADALEQLCEHDAAIQRGDWKQHGLSPGPTVHLVVTYGEYSTINTPFFRDRVEAKLKLKGWSVTVPYVVLSLQQLDSVIRLVEIGKSVEEIVFRLASSTLSNVLELYQPDLEQNMVSRFSHEFADALLDDVVPIGG